MPFESTKPTRLCKFCKKEVQNLAQHIINMHPSVVEQLEEGEAVAAPQSMQSLPAVSYPQQQNKSFQSINDMIREKLDTMLNIKIIEMLSSSKDMSLPELKKALEPQQNTQLSDVIALHDAIYKNQKPGIEINTESESSGWVELAAQAIPLIKEMLPKKQPEVRNDTERVGVEERNIGIRRLIPQEIAGNTGIAESPSGQPSPIISAEQQDNSGDAAINTGAQ